MNPQCTAACIALKPQSVLAHGLDFDRADIAIVTDVDWQKHLGGEYDLYNRDKVFGVFRSAVDVILPGGTAVLNAADEMALEMKPLSQAGVILFAVDPQLPALLEHHEQGHPIVTLRGTQMIGQLKDTELLLGEVGADKVASLAAAAAVWHLSALSLRR